jgi:hypothetical protein
VAFLGLLATGHVDEDAEHDPVDHADIVSLTSSGDPPDFVPHHDPKVDLIRAQNPAGRRESCPHPIAIRRMDTRGQVLKGHTFFASRHAPHVIRALVHGEPVGVDVPRPQGYPGRVNGAAQVFCLPHWEESIVRTTLCFVLLLGQGQHDH